jgi:aminopeptidase N
VNVDGDKILLCEKKDNKTLDNFIFQYKYAGKYVDRREAIDYCAKHQEDPKAVDLLKAAMKDPFYRLRSLTLTRINMKRDNVKTAVEPLLLETAENDPNRVVKAKAIELLGAFKNPSYKALFVKATADSSYSVSGDALTALSELDSAGALAIAKRLVTEPAKGGLTVAIAGVLIKSGDVSNFDAISENFEKMPVGQAKFQFSMSYATMLGKVANTDKLKKGVDLLIQFKEAIPSAFRGQTDPVFDNMLQGVAKKRQEAGMQDQADYITSRLTNEKKGF